VPLAVDTSEARVSVDVGSFFLDKYEVTLGRFRSFLADYDSWRSLGNPRPGAGGHPRIPGLGWQERYAGDMPESAELFEGRVRLCSEVPLATLDLPNAPSQVPLNCVSWHEAAAFCTWDGGRLPSYAESYYAGVGGALDRTYPWGDDPPPSQVYALYGCAFGFLTPQCTAAYVLPVGSHPAGAGLYGQHDLAGSLTEWLLDGSPAAFTEGCSDCGALASTDEHYWRGGSWLEDADSLRNAPFVIAEATLRLPFLGLRCARDP
jgi:formylglycine-generating enzyme required for sulfatase activity